MSSIIGLGFTSTLSPAFLVLGKLIVQSDPMQLAACSGVINRRQPVWVIKATGGDVDLIGVVLVPESQLRTTLRTETARALRG